MKKTIITAFLLLFVCTTGFSQQFIVGTYNLRFDAAGDVGNLWKDRHPHLVQLIKFHGFDIFGTQEGFKHQLEDVKAKLPGFEYIGVGREDGKEGGEFSAIFYNTQKFELLKYDNFWLAEDTEKPNRGWDAGLVRVCTWGLFKDVRTGFQFFLFNAHFDHVGVEARKESAKLIIRKAHELGSDTPMIITGDFNVDQNSEGYHTLNNSGTVKDAYELSPLKYAPNGTFNGFDINRASDSRIDHIFLSKPFHVVRYGILTDNYQGKLPSDHYPVMAEVHY